MDVGESKIFNQLFKLENIIIQGIAVGQKYNSVITIKFKEIIFYIHKIYLVNKDLTVKGACIQFDNYECHLGQDKEPSLQIFGLK